MGDKPNLDGARMAARVILSAIRAEDGQRAFQYHAAATVHDSRFDRTQRRETIRLIQRAKDGDRDARAAVHATLGWMVAERVLIPGPLRRYLLELLAADGGPRKRGQSAARYFLRDQLIAHAVGAVTAYGFAPTRNRETEAPSACSIVKEVLVEFGQHMSERNVERIAVEAS
jgi:hypothetical protein